MTVPARYTADSITDDALDALYAERDRLARAVRRVRQMAEAWQTRLPDTIRTAAAVDALLLATENALPAYDEADRLAAEARIVLRDCLMPGCLRQFDVAAHMDGRVPVRPEWSGDRWQMFTGLLPGRDYGCPDHAPLIARHMTHVAQADGLTSAVCVCRQFATTRRWHGAARAMWEEHLLDVADEAALPAHDTQEPTRA